MPTASSAAANASTLPIGSTRPAPRNTRAKATDMCNASAAGSSSCSGIGGGARRRRGNQLADTVLADALLVLAVLEHCAERGGHEPIVEGGGAEPAECGRPVDRLGDAGRLVEVQLAHRCNGSGNLAGEALGNAGYAQADDGHLALEAGVLDPVVQAAALQRIVDVTSAVRREDHHRRHSG